MNPMRVSLSLVVLFLGLTAGCQEPAADPNENYEPTPDVVTPSPGEMESTPTPSR
ncbi:hypothetical protein Poly24_38280 [Rosistilla carotiformis]|uniref:Uncharacterized protein n=1 Tax=Rosistilla carotiformis TaxID=2528017 RepID=A0A518JX45_9BACT|nr:hypothetical protein Poly24_38280 [Rosistilla carotiformis]